MTCACLSYDAMACYRLRYNIDYEDYADPDDACECICHDRQESEDED